MREYLIGVDLGTSGTKAVLARADGTVVDTARRSHAMSLPRPGWAEMDASRDWWGDAAAVIGQLVRRAAGTPIAGICVSGLGPCIVPCDGRDEPLRAAVLYGIDMRAAAQIAQLTERLGAEAIVRRCGKSLSSQAVGPKLLWIRDELPELWRRTRRWYSSHSFVVARLTGEYVIDHPTASQCDPFYDLRRTDWAHDWVDELIGGLELPRLVWPGEAIGAITSRAAAATGLTAGVPVIAGTVDAWAEAFSAGVRRRGDAMLMYGSTMFFLQLVDAADGRPGMWMTTGVEAGTYTLCGGPATSGSLTEWVREVTGQLPFGPLVDEAARTPPGADGLMMLPYFAGERSPLFDPDARGIIVGLSTRHGRGHLLRAAYEGIAYGMRQILEAANAGGDAPRRIMAVGGGTQGDLWTQIVSDVTGCEQELPDQTIGASYGSALLAAIGTGRAGPATDWAHLSRRVTPDPANRESYERGYETFCSLYPATRAPVHELIQIQAGSGLS